MKIVSLVLLSLTMAAMATAEPFIVAHRGASYDAPENTLAAMKEAEKQKAPAWELDILYTADDRLVLMHDKSTSRTAGVDLVVTNTHSSELRKLEVGSWKDPKFKGEPIAYLEEVLEILPADTRLFIEIKSGRKTVPLLAELIKEHPKFKQFTMICFDLETCILTKALMPELPVYWLVSAEKKRGKPQPFSEDLITIAKHAGLDGLDLNYAGITEEFVKKAKAEGLEVHAWTVDNPAEARRLSDTGIDSITTNRPAFIAEALKQK